jgi:DNA-binding response OmpR family regulator
MAQARTLLIVDDDEDLRGALAEQLELEADFRVRQASTAAAGFQAAGAERPDLIVLDVDLPDGDGRDLCRRMRDAGVACPIVMLTGATEDTDTIRGLDSGADDYVTKPFRFAVLLARIRAHLRSHEASENAVFRIGPYAFHPAQKLLVEEPAEGAPKPRAPRKIRLTEKESSILRYLYRAGGQPVGREELLAEVWGYNAGVTTHTLETHVYRLRQKVEPEPGEARLLLTEAGGYRLQA